MIKEIKKINDSVFKPLDLKISDIFAETECKDYFGFNFIINQTKIKFRKSKLTPKKMGQFVSFWKRCCDGKTIPFDRNDDFDYYIISIEENDDSGFFIFPKVILEKENLISAPSKTGKRGFRIYADWHFPDQKQAVKTKLWQAQYFINFRDEETVIRKKKKKIFLLKRP